MHPLEPDADTPGYLFVRLAGDVEKQIALGELSPGARLPGEVALAEQYAVSVSTVRRAMDVLVERGLIDVVPAKGRFVRHRADQAGPAG
nr:winged helix-turn-helix domain-containing protein [Phytoactinopolyspora mesophila]